MILEQNDFSPEAVMDDISNRKRYLLDRAADLSSEFAVLIHDNERRWRVFRLAVERIKERTPKAKS